MSSRSLMLEAEEARRLLDEWGLEGEEREITAASETPMPEVLAALAAAEREDDARIAACKQGAQELRLRAERIQTRIDRRRDEMAWLLERVGITSLDCGTVTISTTTTPPAVQVVEPDAIPREYLTSKTTTSPNKVAIGAALRAGQDVPGAVLGNARKTITIRRT